MKISFRTTDKALDLIFEVNVDAFRLYCNEALPFPFPLSIF